MTFTEVTDTSAALHRALFFFWKQAVARSFRSGCLGARAAGTSLRQCSSFPHDAAHRLGLRGGRHSSHLLPRWRASPNLFFLSAPVPNELCQRSGSCSEEKTNHTCVNSGTSAARAAAGAGSAGSYPRTATTTAAAA